MPLPSKSGKDENTFMKECVSQMVNEGKDQDQAVAICMTEWKAEAVSPEVDMKEKKPKGKLELLNDVKKMFEKNGHSISDEVLLDMFKKIDNKTFTHKLDIVANINELPKEEALNKVFTIQVFPKKKCYVQKYDEYIDFNDKLFDDFIKGFQNPKLFKPFGDKNHQLDAKYFDIIDLFKTDIGLYADIKLNEDGYDAIKNKKYSYISPEWGSRIDTDAQKHNNVLWAITLTNIPALEGENPTLQDQIKLNKRGENMDNLEKRLLKLESKLESHRLAVDPNAAPAMPPELLDAIAMIKEALMKIDELTKAKDAAEEIAGQAQEEMNKLNQEKREQEKALFFKEVVEKGQVEPKELSMWQDHYDKSPEFVKSMLTSRVVKDSKQMSRTVIDLNKVELSDEDKYIMSQSGMKEEDYKKYVLGGK